MCGQKILPRSVGAKNAHGIMEVMEISLEETATIAELHVSLLIPQLIFSVFMVMIIYLDV
jgi:hypothetical protein